MVITAQKPTQSVSYDAAREIMGSDFIGLDTASNMGLDIPASALSRFRLVPFSAERLDRCRDTHLLVARVAASIVQLVEKNGTFFYAETGKPLGYLTQSFARNKGEPGWALVSKHPIEGSFNHILPDQMRLLDGNHETLPSAATMVYAILGYHFNTSVRLFANSYARTASSDMSGRRIIVGNFKMGLCLHVISDMEDHPQLGIAPAMTAPLLSSAA